MGENEDGVLVSISFNDKDIYLSKGNYYTTSRLKKLLKKINDNGKINKKK